jgi:hypothetical protein
MFDTCVHFRGLAAAIGLAFPRAGTAIARFRRRIDDDARGERMRRAGRS